jgi:hypothetical protein
LLQRQDVLAKLSLLPVGLIGDAIHAIARLLYLFLQSYVALNDELFRVLLKFDLLTREFRK